MANSVEDYLIDGLSFKMKGGASYITDRQSVTYHPQGSNIYTPTGTTVIKLLISGDQWLDPSTCRIMFDLRNMATSATCELRPLGGPWTFFRRIRCLCNGQVIEDIDNYNRCHELFSILTPYDCRDNLEIEGFGKTCDHTIHMDVDDYYTPNNFSGIYGGQAQTALFKPLLGILGQSKYLPLRYCPLTIELELVNHLVEPIIPILGDFNNGNTSVLWQIENVQLKCDTCSLDNALDNSYAQH